MVRRFIWVLSVLGVAGLISALPASAHVTVSADNATQGAYSVISIRVPNEESNAQTVALKVQLPVDHPFAHVAVQPKPGWTFTTKTVTLDKPIKTGDTTISEAVSEISWTGGKIAPGEFDQFTIQAGPLPTDTDSLVFKAIQTYQDADGSKHDVAWIETSTPGGPEAEHPAPVLKLRPAGASMDDSHSSDDATSHHTTTAPSVTATTESSSSSGSGSNTPAIVLGALALAVALAALALTFWRNGKPDTSGRGDARANQRGD